MKISTSTALLIGVPLALIAGYLVGCKLESELTPYQKCAADAKAQPSPEAQRAVMEEICNRMARQPGDF